MSKGIVCSGTEDTMKGLQSTHVISAINRSCKRMIWRNTKGKTLKYAFLFFTKIFAFIEFTLEKNLSNALSAVTRLHGMIT